MDKDLISIDPCPFQSQKETKKSILPSPLRCLIIGSSSAGKTTFVWNLIQKELISFKKLFVFSKTLNQDVYQAMEKIFGIVKEKVGEQCAYFTNNLEDIPPVEECEDGTLFIFDDCIFEKQSPIKQYFAMGRHYNVSCIYLVQCYTLADLKTIRSNLNFVVLFKISDTHLKLVYDNFVSGDLEFKQFKELCLDRWQNKYGFLTISMNENDKYKRIFK